MYIENLCGRNEIKEKLKLVVVVVVVGVVAGVVAGAAAAASHNLWRGQASHLKQQDLDDSCKTCNM